MVKEIVTLQFKNGLEARPAALFVQLASKYQSNIFINVMEKKVNAKSIMGMMSLGTIKGATLELQVDGNDEAEATKALVDFLSLEEVTKASI
ncbi:MAG: PTS sugar transporter subunit IIA [Epulopiscium sp. Nele67-Bin002]|nr:MAG: PTS sugar transporter subunit IIA [Epulopiscium sp. Nuni2H_MBin001]OON92223.1 MAG: PTS sugar transporter subunit IIA [Epulopiscium sp. Nele67-Bin002]OON93934.1 MAG: PTS sugar transporter subunit IIA [Epulopiscium sp. Nele67-Bin001]